MGLHTVTSKRGLRDSLHLSNVQKCVCVSVSVCQVSSSAGTTPCISQGSLLSFSFSPFIVPPSSRFSPSRWAVLRWSRLLTSLPLHCVHAQWDHWGDSRVPVSSLLTTPVCPPSFSLKVRWRPDEVDVTVWRYEAKYSSKSQSVCCVGLKIIHYCFTT